jgi:hypothetical protein
MTLRELNKIVVTESKPEPTPDELEIIIFTKENIRHYEARFDSSKDYQFNREGKTYNIRKKQLLKKSRGLSSYLHLRNRIRESYMIFFDEDNMEPTELSFTEPKVSSRIVYIAMHSQTLGTGLLSLFRKPFSLPLNAKTIIFIIIVVAVIGGVIYAMQTGALKF